MSIEDRILVLSYQEYAWYDSDVLQLNTDAHITYTGDRSGTTTKIHVSAVSHPLNT